MMTRLLPELRQRDTQSAELWFCRCDDFGDVQAFSLPHILIHILHPQQRSFTQTWSTARWGTDHNNCWTPGNIFLHLRQTGCDVYGNPIARKKWWHFKFLQTGETLHIHISKRWNVVVKWTPSQRCCASPCLGSSMTCRTLALTRFMRRYINIVTLGIKFLFMCAVSVVYRPFSQQPCVHPIAG